MASEDEIEKGIRDSMKVKEIIIKDINKINVGDIIYWVWKDRSIELCKVYAEGFTLIHHHPFIKIYTSYGAKKLLQDDLLDEEKIIRLTSEVKE